MSIQEPIVSSIKFQFGGYEDKLQSPRPKQQSKSEQAKNQSQQDQSKLDISKKERNFQQNSHMQSPHEEDQSKRQLNMYRTQFAAAWKLQTGFGILTIEKVSQIVHNYFKMIPELVRRNQQIQILVIYNKSLLEIMNKFEDHQRKILSKLKTMEQFNIKIMKQLCSLKKKQFKLPQIKEDQSIFCKFSLKDLKYQPPVKKQNKIDENYENKLKDMMKDYLLQPLQCLSQVQRKIQQLESQKQTNIISNQLQDLKQLKQNILGYNKQIKNVTTENMFDLHSLKQNIVNQVKRLKMIKIESPSAKEQIQKGFVQQMLKIHAGLINMQQSQLQTYLKMEKQSRKRIKRQRVKQQQHFLRECEKAESQNTQLKKDIGHFKQKIGIIQQQLNKTKAQLDFKNMKQRANKSSLLQESMINQSNIAKEKKNLTKQTHKAMETDLKKIKEENEKLQKKINQNETRELSRPIIMNRIRQRAKSLKINIDPAWQQTKIIEVLLQKISDTIKRIPQTNKLSHSMQVHKQDQLISPRLQQKLFGFGNISQAQFLKTIQEKNQTQDIQQIQSRNKQLQKEIIQLKKKNEQNKRLLASKDQVLRKTYEDHQADLKLKNSKINQLVKQYEQFQNQIKQYKFHNQLLRVKNEWAERLSEKIIKSIESITIQDISPSKSLILVAELFQKLKVIIGEYKDQIKKQQEAYEEKRQVNIREQMSNSRNLNHSNDQSALSLKSMFPKLKQKRQSQSPFIFEKQQFNKLNNQKFKKIKSLTSEAIEQIEKDERFMKKFSKKKNEQLLKDSLKNLQFKSQLKNHSSELKSSSKQENKKMEQESYESQHQNGNKKLRIQNKSSTQLGLHLKETNNRRQLTKTQNLEVIRGQKIDNNQSDMKEGKSSHSGDKSVSRSKQKQQQNKSKSGNVADKMGNVLNFQDNLNENVLSDIQLKQQKSKDSQNNKKKSNTSLDNMKNQLNQDNPEKKKISKRMEKIQTQAKQLQTKIDEQKSSQSILSPTLVSPTLSPLKQMNSKQQMKIRVIDNNNNQKQYKQIKTGGVDINQSKEKNSQKFAKYETPTSKQIKTNQLNNNQKQIKLVKKQSQKSQSKINKKDQINLSKKRSNQLIVEDKQRQDKQFKDQLSRLSQQTSRVVDQSEPIIRINNVTRKHESFDSSKVSKDSKNKNQIPFNSQRNSSIQDVSLSYSRDASVQKNKETHLKSNLNHGIVQISDNNSKLHSVLDKEGQYNPNNFHQQILEKLSQKAYDLDSLDFFQLFKRYTQALACLDTAQQVNKMYEIRYQKFVKGLKAKKDQSEHFSYEEQLFYMQKLIDQQSVQINIEDKKFNQSVIKHIKTSQSLIQRQLRIMRQQFNAENGNKKSRKNF